MAIPDFQTLLLPLLEFSADGQEHATVDAAEALASRFQLTDAERNGESFRGGRRLSPIALVGVPLICAKQGCFRRGDVATSR